MLDEWVAPTTRMPSTRPTAVGAKARLKLAEPFAGIVTGVGRPDVVKPAPETPSAERLTWKLQMFRSVMAVTAERQPVCTVPKSMSFGAMRMQFGLGIGTQTPVEQTWPGPHATQLLPEWPHAVADVEVDAVQVPLLQQPLHVVGPHAEPPEQTPVVQVAPGAQAVHVEPLLPHESGVWLPVIWQAPFEQHPGHERKSHAAVIVQLPAVQELFVGQTVHARPPEPHCVAFCAPNGTHRFP